MISRAEILKGREGEYPLDAQLEHNLARLLVAVNKLRAEYGRPITVTSGYRPGRFNTAAGGAKRSAHLRCLAIDLADPKGELAKWALERLPDLQKWGLLGVEDPSRTPGWLHLDLIQRFDSKGQPIHVFKP